MSGAMISNPLSNGGLGPPKPGRAGAPPGLDAVEVWLFDLDNTLYPASSRLFDQIDRRMGRFIERLLSLEPEAARALQKRYFQDHGTTMRGLMEHHGVDPRDYLAFVHEIDLAPIAPDPALDRALDALPGRKLVFTNASARHAERVMARLGVARHFEAVFDIADAGYQPKPGRQAYDRLIERHGVDPRRAAFIEDSARNLAPAAELGMTTVWVETDSRWAGEGHAAEHVHHVTDDLGAWLTALTEPGSAVRG